MGAVSAQEGLVHLLRTGNARLRSGHLQTSPGKLPMVATMDPHLEKPLVLQLQGDFSVYLRCTERALATLQEKSTLEVSGVCFVVRNWQPLLPENESVECLQAAAAVTPTTVMAQATSCYRLTCSGGQQYIAAGSLVASGDIPGSVLYTKDGQTLSVLPYTLFVSF